mmetsp:Transcript_40723/g.88706  ORF Transcript_40723/g.88706 Transcript_40723/m.88706 type:complete len:537 (-) Transcript_40723:197-1807(-)
MATPFVDPETLTTPQLMFVTAIYGNVLFTASDLISDGSELLLLVPSLAGLVGSVVLPVLGAVPDGMMVLFSGMGDDAQEQVSVGVGAMAGSTIMLLTFPWFLAVIGGRVNLDKTGAPMYSKPKNFKGEWAKLMPAGNFSLSETGVACGPSIRENAVLMVVTACLFFVVQGPASYATHTIESRVDQAAFVNNWAGVGLLGTIIGFFYYLNLQAKNAAQDSERRQIEKQIVAIKAGTVSLAGAMKEVFPSGQEKLAEGADARAMDKLTKVLRPFFDSYDVNGDKTIDCNEFRALMKDLGEPVTDTGVKALFNQADRDHSGSVEFEEFRDLILTYMEKLTHFQCLDDDDMEEPEGDDDEEEEEELEVPEDLMYLSPEAQQVRIKLRAFYKMGIGTIMVLIFSDPAVDVLTAIGHKLEVKPFYVSFILAPFASNASELVAAYAYAGKKTASSMTISLATLEGAACMNNTWCLAIFFGIVYFRHLYWAFTAETIVTVLIQVMVACIAQKRTMRLMDAFIVLGFYPMSLVLIWYMENKLGMD